MGTPVYEYLLATRIAFGKWCRHQPSGSYRRNEMFARRRRLADTLAPEERYKLQIKGAPSSEAIAFTLDGKGKLVEWRHYKTAGYSVMWRGKATGVWWIYERRIRKLADALAILHSEEFAARRNR